jgi:multiple sugar transport system permease protein
MKRILDGIGLWIAVALLVSPALFFFVWMLSLSLKYEIDNAASPPVLIPGEIAWQNYADVLSSNRFPLYFLNSIIVTGSATLIGLLVGVPAGFGLARL